MRNNGISRKTLAGRRIWFWLSGGALLVTVAGVLFFIPLSLKKENKRYSGPPKTREEAIERIQRDLDNDGLKDWEENIYGTDSEREDTDGDGTSDGEEIKVSRNPLRPGPEDKLSIPLPPPTDGNKTEALANEFIGHSLTQILAESINGGNLTEDLSNAPALNNYINSLGKEHLLNKVIPPDKSEFKISQDNSPEAVKKYLNSIFKIHFDNFSQIDSDISILYLAATGNNPKAFRRLDANVAAIEKVVQETKNIAVPSNWFSFAEDYVWHLSKTLAAVKILKNSETDPVSSLLILNDRIQIMSDLNALYADAKKELTASKIVFGGTEPAAFLTKQR